ncbi:hypothetical protein GBAR_LOCUS27429, partial [Geodia barretti]
MIAPPSEEAPVITRSNEPILHHSPNTTAVVCVPELKAKGEGLSSQVGKTWTESDLRLASSGDQKHLTVTKTVSIFPHLVYCSFFQASRRSLRPKQTALSLK